MEILQFKNVSKSFGGLKATDDVSFDIKPGEIMGLIGPNGAGKTTIFNMASGFIQSTKGEILFNQRKITGLSPDAICRLGLCRTFQIVKPFGDMTVLDNIIVGSLLRTRDVGEAKDEALKILESLDMTGLKDKIAKSLTLAGRKHLEVARALATRPQMLLLDEVMAGLTSVETMEIVAMIRKLRENQITVLLIEHIMQAVMSLSDRIVVIHHGQKISEGDPKFVANDEKVIKAYLGEEYHEFTKS